MTHYLRDRSRRYPLARSALALAAVALTRGCNHEADPVATTTTEQQLGSILASEPVGTLPGELGVTADGAASYDIPLWLPPGRAGIEPALTIRYSSRGGNGLLGVGWMLTGLSAIEPCNRTWAVDGDRAGAVTLTAGDAYCLDGARLVASGATAPGENGETSCTEYRTLPDSFSRIVQCTGANTWYVRSKDGRILHYGTGGGRIQSSGLSPIAWLVEKVTDRSGNTMTFAYKRSGGTPGVPACGGGDRCLEFRPDHIDYTAGSGLPATRSVVFEYDATPRPDRTRRYLHGITIDINDRIKRIRAVADGATVRTYDFAYVPSPTSGRTRLTQVQTCDREVESGGACMPATAFTYTSDLPGTGPWGHLPSRHGTIPGYRPTDPLYFTDVDGDGRDDMVYWTASPANWIVRRSTGLDFGAPEVQPIPQNGSPPRGSLMFDVNGDGMTDLVTAACECPNGASSCPSPTRCDRARAYVWDHAANHFVLAALPNLQQTWTASVSVVDAVGDGTPSYVQAVNTDTSFPFWQVLQNEFGPGSISGTSWSEMTRSFFRDVDGDGKQEFLRFIPNGTNTEIDALTVERFSPAGTTTTRRSLASGPAAQAMMNSHCLLWADFNGDRQVDAIDPPSGQLFWNLGLLGVDHGGVKQVTWWTQTQGAMPSCGDLDAGYRVADFNADGLLDVLVLGKVHAPGGPSEFARVFITRADGSMADALQLPVELFNPDQPFPPPPPNPEDPPPVPPPYVGAKNTRLIDVNGDGHFDIFQMDGQQSFVLDVQAALPVDLLISAHNGMGRTETVSYATLADLPDQFTRCFTPGCFNGPLTVAYSHTTDNGAGGATFRHTYRDARVDRKGFGFLGFGSHDVTDQRNNTVVRTIFDNTTLVSGAPPGTAWYARLGMPIEVLRYVNDLGTWHASRSRATVISPLTTNNKSYFSYPLFTENKIYEGATFTVAPPGAPDPQLDCPNFSPRCAGLIGSSTNVIFTDTFGNTTTTNTMRYVMTAGSTAQYFDAIDLTYDPAANDVSQWLIGHPTLRTQRSTATGYPDGTPRTTRYSYDTRGNVIAVEREPGSAGAQTTTCAAGSPDPLYQRTKLGRDPATGLVTRITVSPSASDGDSRERTTTIAFDPQFLFPRTMTKDTGTAAVPQLATQATVHTGLGVRLRGIDENGAASDFDFDGFGRPRAARYASGAIRTFHYQRPAAPYALAVSITGNDGSATTTYVDRLDRAVRSTRTALDGRTAIVDTVYDAFGRIDHMTRPHFGDASPVYYAMRYEYDALGRIIRQHRHDSSSATTGTPTTTYLYGGLITIRFDESGIPGLSLRDGAGHIIETQTFPPNQVAHTGFSFGPFETLRTVTDPNGNVVTMGYDALGRQTDLTEGDTGHAVSAYNEFDEVAVRTDAKGQTTCVTSDKLGRPILRTAPDGTDRWTWDTASGGKGRLAASTRTPLAPETPVSSSYAYDPRGITHEDWMIDGSEYQIDHNYDAIGREIRTVYPSAPGMAGPFAVDQLYNARGYPTQVRDVTVPSAPAVLWTVNAADAEDHLLTETLGNGLTVDSEYFPDTGLLKHRLTPNVYDMQYEYDPNGNLHSRTDRFNSGWPGLQKVDTETFSYDGANRLKQVTLSNPSGVVRSFTYGYDVLGNVIQASDAPQCTDYIYGANGAGPHQLTRATCFTTPYAHNYDANGNETETVAPDFREQTWTSFDKLDEMRTRFGRMKYFYDANHNRVRKTRVPGIISWMTDPPPPGGLPLDGLSGAWDTTHYVGQLYEKRTGSGLATIDHVFYLFAGGRRLGQMTWHQAPGRNTGTAEWSYYHLDYQGTVERTTDASKAVREFSSSSAWGARRQSDWEYFGGVLYPQNTRIGYTGHSYEDEFGTIDMNGRIYDPYFKRFLSADPLVQAPLHGPSWNRYSYLWNNPLNATDPTGFGGECSPADPNCGDKTNPILGTINWFIHNAGAIARTAGDVLSTIGSVFEDFGHAAGCVFTLGFSCGGGRSASAPGLSASGGGGNDGRAAEAVSRVDPIAGNLLGAPPASGGGGNGGCLAGGCVAAGGVAGFGGALGGGLGGPTFTSFEPFQFIVGKMAHAVISQEIIANNVGDWTILADARVDHLIGLSGGTAPLLSPGNGLRVDIALLRLHSISILEIKSARFPAPALADKLILYKTSLDAGANVPVFFIPPGALKGMNGEATSGFLRFTWSSMNAGEIRYTWKFDLSRLAVPAAAAAGVGAAAWGWSVLRGIGGFVDKAAGATMFLIFILPQQHGDPA